MSAAPEQPSFDAYARDYEGALNRGLSLTGESRDFYARRRVEIMHETCERIGLQVATVCDYGCGTGDTVPLLRDVLGARRVIGLDPSCASLDEARRRHAGCIAEWSTPGADESAALSGQVDAVYCNGVFHHIPPPQRGDAAREIMRLLRPGGCWFFWENNPL
jgi:2-polyprenyl-3-methyl-5-hydroxy-6-metoxy-1,4-benzoquinol methylase